MLKDCYTRLLLYMTVVLHGLSSHSNIILFKCRSCIICQRSHTFHNVLSALWIHRTKFTSEISSRLNVVQVGAIAYRAYCFLSYDLLSLVFHGPSPLGFVFSHPLFWCYVGPGPYPTTISFGRATGIDMLSHLPISTSMANIASWCSPRPTTPTRSCSHADLFTWVITSILPISYTNIIMLTLLFIWRMPSSMPDLGFSSCSSLSSIPSIVPWFYPLLLLLRLASPTWLWDRCGRHNSPPASSLMDFVVPMALISRLT